MALWEVNGTVFGIAFFVGLILKYPVVDAFCADMYSKKNAPDIISKWVCFSFNLQAFAIKINGNFFI